VSTQSRRKFLADVGRGMLVASVGATAIELSLAPALADEPERRLNFGELEPLVAMLQETPADKLLPLVVEKLHAGVPLKTLVSAGALANARAFGGNDYTGYHTFMALAPAYQMALELPDSERPLPVLKVLHRNTSRMQERELGHADVLHPVDAAAPAEPASHAWVREAVRRYDDKAAEARFAYVAERSVADAFEQVQDCVQDEVNVHRVVLAWRAWAMLSLTGQEHAHTLLRQSVRFCLDAEQHQSIRNRPPSEIRELLPKLIDEHTLARRPLGTREVDDAWIDTLAATIYSGSRAQAAEAVAAALAEGIDPEAVGEAISLAAARLVLHDPGRRPEHSSAHKPAGCVHGDSVGVHASDAANAWRNIARASRPLNRAAALIVCAFHTAGQTDWVTEEPYPYAGRLEQLRVQDAEALLAEADRAIRGNDQAGACAVVHRYGELGHPVRPLFDLLLKYAVSEDGALHAEKYYRTVSEEYTATRAAFRWRHMVALARVTASQFGFAAPGYAQSRELLRLS
jgi:hypothetical protein